MRKFIIILISVCCTTLSFGQVAFEKKLSDAAIELTKDKVVYDPQYFKISFPNGDVPQGKGVCTDVVIRAYRKAFNHDLQLAVHQDMKKNFRLYPKNWGMATTDTNIDHRRVYNLMKFFDRKNASLKINKIAQDYRPGDLVCWDLGGGKAHIGIVVKSKTSDGLRNQIVHNIGGGQVMEDVLFAWKLIGHYRYQP